MLSTKFTPRSVPTLRSPPSVPSAYSKEHREAALRARGLLPPLPNKDLSTQEQEQDHHIPIVRQAESKKSSDDDASQPSAADLIKKEWVAKNNTDDSTKDSKLGGAVDITDNSRSSLPDQAVSPTKSELPSSRPPTPSVEPGLLPSSSRELPPKSLTMERPSSLLADLSEEIQAFMFPLPPSLSPSPSPSPSLSQRNPKTQSPPQSPPQHSSAAPHTPSDDKSGACGASTGTCTPRPPATHASASASDPETETDDAPQTDPTHLRVNNRDSCGEQTEESHSDASIMTPSLDSTSQTASSSSHGSSSSAAATALSATAGKSRGGGGGLHVKPPTCDAAPEVRIVSPMAEHQFSEELGVVMEEDSRPPSPSPLESSEMGVKFKVDERDAAHTHSAAGGTDVDSGAVSTAAATAKGLNLKASVERKRSMNPFKRAGTVSGAHGKDATDAGESPAAAAPRRRLTMGTSSFSMSNIRRSVVGSLSGRPANIGTQRRAKTFDASHLPPSPTSPVPRASTGTRASSSVGGRTMPVTPVSPTRARQPQQVVMYNRGSILLETAGIEDEETRRMTELAFLG